MSNKKQTAVEWLEYIIEAMIENGGDLGEDYPAIKSHLSKAKEMEKEQMIDIAYKQIENCHTEMGEIKYSKVPEELYKETYGE